MLEGLASPRQQVAVAIDVQNQPVLETCSPFFDRAGRAGDRQADPLIVVLVLKLITSMKNVINWKTTSRSGVRLGSALSSPAHRGGHGSSASFA